MALNLPNVNLPDSPLLKALQNECDRIKEMLIQKNISYGNSVFHPINIFSKSPAEEQLRVRIDDKLKRVQAGKEYPGDDTINDLIGYLILYKIFFNDPTAKL